MNARGDEGADWPFPRSVPSCISLHLKTCEEEETKKQRKVVLGVAVTLLVRGMRITKLSKESGMTWFYEMV